MEPLNGNIPVSSCKSLIWIITVIMYYYRNEFKYAHALVKNVMRKTTGGKDQG